MSRSTISTFKLFELFPDEPSARKYLEARLWKDGVICPECAGKDRITIRKDGYYRGYTCIKCVHEAAASPAASRWPNAGEDGGAEL